MSNREFFLKQFQKEAPKFVSVIRAMPTDRLDYKPHERSTPAGGLAWFLVIELRALLDLVKTGENHWTQPPVPDSTDAIADAYEQTAKEMTAALASVDDAQWASDTRMYFGEFVRTEPLGETIWDFFFDAIHHRGQLSTYLRPMGGTVPSIYGPSGDSK